MIEMDGDFKKDIMALFEYSLYEHNDDDWFVSDCSLDYIGIKEYRMYEDECEEVAYGDVE